MGTVNYNDLTEQGRRKAHFGSDLLVKTTGYSDKVIHGGLAHKATIKSLRVTTVDEAVTTAGFSVQFGTVNSAGAYGTVTVASTDAVGSSTVEEVDVDWPANTALVIDQSSVSSGVGKYKVGFEYEYDTGD